jgi:hypothetical protein
MAESEVKTRSRFPTSGSRSRSSTIGDHSPTLHNPHKYTQPASAADRYFVISVSSPSPSGGHPHGRPALALHSFTSQCPSSHHTTLHPRPLASCAYNQMELRGLVMSGRLDVSAVTSYNLQYLTRACILPSFLSFFRFHLAHIQAFKFPFDTRPKLTHLTVAPSSMQRTHHPQDRRIRP